MKKGPVNVTNRHSHGHFKHKELPLMINSKIELEHAFSALQGKLITSVWYKGKTTISEVHHSAEEGIFFELSNGEVFHIYPGDELNQKLIHGIYIKQIKHWEKERRYFKKIENISDIWGHFLGKEIQLVRLNWEIIGNHTRGYGYPKSLSDYAHGVEFKVKDEPLVYLDVMKVFDDNTKATLGYPEITVFFDSERRRKQIERFRIYQL
ncbi:hypothetical protein [Psychromonas algicola]|uniref:hypothetical protein n=1 Tax=Psychromonas algicola TaxID=2555642 RepID=UPI0010680912|nr:hypothetical protein [Psychromonas sp. RZ5]TEW51684.1 hypothetical protein E2R67_06830 [Psychromonas sp. RZ5]